MRLSKKYTGRIVWAALLALVAAFVLTSLALAQGSGPGTVTDDQVNAVARQLYCPVCENVPLDVCPTKACAQWRDLIREKMELGWSEKEIKEFFAEQYGAQVLAVPPREGFNWLIYVLPPLVVIIGIVIVARTVGKPRKTIAGAPVVEQPAVPAAQEEILDEIEKDLRREA
mgnify:CR=1 FL=1